MIIRRDEVSVNAVGLGFLRKQLLRKLDDGFTERNVDDIEKEIRKKLIDDLKKGKLKIPA